MHSDIENLVKKVTVKIYFLNEFITKISLLCGEVTCNLY